MYVMYVCFGASTTPDLHNMSLLVAFQLLLLLLASPSLSCASNSTQSTLDRQAEALLQWKASLNTGSLDSWRKGTSPCNWTGVTCSTTVPRGRHQGDAALAVSEISLYDYSLNGSLDGLQFVELPHLVHLDLKYNALWGPIPSTIGVLDELLFLDLSANNLDGSIPLSIGNFRKLISFDISYSSHMMYTSILQLAY
jgi:hypothetical protein